MSHAYFYIERDKCINCGACFLICKKCFVIENNIVKEIKHYSDNEEEIKKLKLAKKACPTNAIYVQIIEREEENIIK